MALLKSRKLSADRRDPADDSRDTVAHLLDQLKGDRGAGRSAAIQALQRVPEELDTHLVHLLNDEKTEIRLWAVELLATLRRPAAAQWLITVIKRDADPGVCAAAIDLLGEVGDHSAVGPLRAAKTRFPKNSKLAFAVEVALGQIE